MKRLCGLILALLLVGSPAYADFAEAVAAYNRHDYAFALGEFEPLAEQGDARAQVMLGFMYYAGQGVPQDHAEAVKWYRNAAEQGAAAGQFNLGTMYYEGKGVPQDYAEAAKWYRASAEQGEASAQTHLGIMYHDGRGVSQNYVLAHMWFNLAAARGDKKSAERRDLTAERMFPWQIAEALQLAREWNPTK